MEKEPQPESLATVTIKPDYAPSEVYSSEPPPAYVKPQSAAVHVARIVAFTVVAVSVILGSFILASAYVTANASCRQLEQELELLNEAADRFQPPPQPEALIQEEPLSVKRQTQADQSAESSKTKEINNNSVDDDNSNDDSSDSSDSSSDSSESDEDDRTPIHFKLPLQLDFDDLAGALIEKNQKSRMNCVVEKKRAEEVVDHQPKTVRLPFGLNLTTDPRYERLSGERMAIFCESGNVQRAQPQEDQEETIMIQPVVIPIPQGHFASHMPQQMRPMPPQFQPQPPQPQISIHPMHRFHPMEQMRPPMPPMVQQQPQQPQQQPQPEFPPIQILQHIAQKIMDSQKSEEQSESEQSEDQRPNIVLPEEVLTQLNRLPNRDVIVAVREEGQDGQDMPPQRIMLQRQFPPQDIDRQTYGRGMMMAVAEQQPQQQDAQPTSQEPEATASEKATTLHMQPRSIRSVDALLPKSQKRVKRCSCDCAC